MMAIYQNSGSCWVNHIMFATEIPISFHGNNPIDFAGLSSSLFVYGSTLICVVQYGKVPVSPQ